MSKETFIKEIAPYAQKFKRNLKFYLLLSLHKLVWRVEMGQAY
ncbi:hypothetical protein [Peribacillus simplex]|nr:hypothetical protein [Peribacillus simplex]MEC1400200.1 hypothetical protein [Peribacillus simplex]MED3912401.1 hypothetical protein [Peribacillus simplex]MED3987038.1 hypothetical protein [Peribacillus simplex]MED4094310.1 hypothetical protein [Peribacillus simplex]CAH0286258.1 hypothetical protein SRABI84_04056 [Peribacillus simplex]